MHLSPEDQAKVDQVKVRVTRPEGAPASGANVSPGRLGKGVVQAQDSAGVPVGRITFKEVDESTAETTDIEAFVKRDGIGLAMVLGLIAEYDVVRESSYTNTEDGEDFVTGLREKGVRYHQWTCRTPIECSCFARF